jgi:hypothetical protein
MIVEHAAELGLGLGLALARNMSGMVQRVLSGDYHKGDDAPKAGHLQPFAQLQLLEHLVPEKMKSHTCSSAVKFRLSSHYGGGIFFKPWPAKIQQFTTLRLRSPWKASSGKA